MSELAIRTMHMGIAARLFMEHLDTMPLAIMLGIIQFRFTAMATAIATGGN